MKHIFMLSILLVAVFAQGPGPNPGEEDDPREIIEKVRIYKLTQALDLTTEQALKFFPKLKDLRKVEQEFIKGKMEIIREIKEIIKREEKASEEKLKALINRYKEINDKKWKGQTEIINEMRDILTPLQQAKYLIFQEDFEREIREVIKEIRKHRPPPPEE